MRYHIIPVRKSIINNLETVSAGKGCGEKGTLLHCWWECKLIQPLWKTLWRLLKKLGTKPPYNLAIPLLGKYHEETKIETDTCTPVLIVALFTIARTWKQPSCQVLSLCDPMDCSTPGFSVPHHLQEFAQVHVHRVGDAIQPSHPLSSSFPPAPNPSQH